MAFSLPDGPDSIHSCIYLFMCYLIIARNISQGLYVLFFLAYTSTVILVYTNLPSHSSRASRNPPWLVSASETHIRYIRHLNNRLQVLKLMACSDLFDLALEVRTFYQIRDLIVIFVILLVTALLLLHVLVGLSETS